MVAHVARSFASRIKFWDQNEAMNLNQTRLLSHLEFIWVQTEQKRQMNCDNCLWATSGLQTKVAQW